MQDTKEPKSFSEAIKEDPVLECFEDKRLVRVKDVARSMAFSLDMLDRTSQNVASAKKKLTRREWNGLVNTVTLTLFSALCTVGMTEEEALAFAARARAKSPCISSMTIVAVPDDDDDDDGDGRPEA